MAPTVARGLPQSSVGRLEVSTTRPVRVAAQLHPQHGDYGGLRRAVAETEELSYDLLYTWDHFYPLYGGREGTHFECWSMLAAWAEQTQTIELGALVTCNSYRNPDLLADMARTVDHISGGRLVFGIGSGWFRHDYEQYGYEFGTAPSRLIDLGRSLPRIIARWERLNPAPVRRPPILIAGVGEQVTLRLVARYADGWHASFPDDPSELEPKVAALLKWCDRHDRDPRSIEWGLGVEPNDLERFLTEDAPTYVEMGFSQFTLGFNGPQWNVSAGAAWLAWRDQVNQSAAG